MNNRLLSAVLCSLIAAPLLAADGDENDFFKQLRTGEGAIQQQQAAAKAAPAKAPAPKFKDQAVIDKTLEAMNDGNEIGGLIAQYVKAHAVKLELDAKLPDYPRVLSIFITEKVAGLALADMPDCSEKQYMGLSLGVRTWLELGGDKKTLPVIEPLDGWKDQILADQFKLWLDNGSEMTLYKIGLQSKTSDLMELLDKEKDPAKKKVLEAANKRFIEFLRSETDWKEINSFRLK